MWKNEEKITSPEPEVTLPISTPVSQPLKCWCIYVSIKERQLPPHSTCLLMQPKFSSVHLSTHIWTTVTPFSSNFQRTSLKSSKEFEIMQPVSFFQSSNCDHVSPLPESMHWLPVSKRSDHTLPCLYHSLITPSPSIS